MSDEVRQAAFIGSAINSGLGGIPTAKKKKPSQDEDKKTKESPKASETTTPSSETKALPKMKNPSSKKPQQGSAPIFVQSERVNKPTITPTKEITAGQIQFSQKPTVGKQFTGYADTYGSTHTQPPTDLSKY
jgi:hypothetical protein